MPLDYKLHALTHLPRSVRAQHFSRSSWLANVLPSACSNGACLMRNRGCLRNLRDMSTRPTCRCRGGSRIWQHRAQEGVRCRRCTGRFCRPGVRQRYVLAARICLTGLLRSRVYAGHCELVRRPVANSPSISALCEHEKDVFTARSMNTTLTSPCDRIAHCERHEPRHHGPHRHGRAPRTARNNVGGVFASLPRCTPAVRVRMSDVRMAVCAMGRAEFRWRGADEADVGRAGRRVHEPNSARISLVRRRGAHSNPTYTFAELRREPVPRAMLERVQRAVYSA